MPAKEQLREHVRWAWRDPVWSKVIATVITAFGGTAIVLIIATGAGLFFIGACGEGARRAA